MLRDTSMVMRLVTGDLEHHSQTAEHYQAYHLYSHIHTWLSSKPYNTFPLKKYPIVMLFRIIVLLMTFGVLHV